MAGHAPIWRHLIGLVPENELSGVKVLDFGCNQGGFLRLLYQLRPFQQGLALISLAGPSMKPTG